MVVGSRPSVESMMWGLSDRGIVAVLLAAAAAVLLWQIVQRRASAGAE